MRQKEYTGFESLKALKEILAKLEAKNIFLVTGKHSYESCGAEKTVKDLSPPYNFTRFYDFETNPKLDDVEKGIALFRDGKREFNVVIAIGGGSAIDMGKLINILAAQPENPAEYVTKEAIIIKQPKPLIAIPTTAGSGSEATHFAVIYIGKTKYSLAHDYILPGISIIDPALMMDLPGKITASTGMDALSQAIESYWCVNSTDVSKEYAANAIKLILDNLVENYSQPSRKTRQAMAKASHLAGKAINITKTTAAHAISYPLTSYFGIPHGHAAGLLLGEVLIHNNGVTEVDIQDSRGTVFVKQTMKELFTLLGCSSADSSKKRIDELMNQIGLETRLSELGIRTEWDIEIILDNINIERLSNNPRSFTRENVKKLLLNIA